MSVKLLAELRPAGNFPVAETSDIQHGNKRLNTVLSDIETVNDSKADKTYVDSQLATKASTTALTEGLATKANTADVTSGLASKADNSTVSALAGRVSTNETNIANISNYVTPQMFGAKADGVTDDISSINNAVSYALSHNIGTVYFPSGTYYISSPIKTETKVESGGTFAGPGLCFKGDRGTEITREHTDRTPNSADSDYNDCCIAICGNKNIIDTITFRRSKVAIYVGQDPNDSSLKTNAHFNQVRNVIIENCGIGIDMVAGYGNYYNTFEDFKISEGVVGIYLGRKYSGANGVSNRNTFSNGEINMVYCGVRIEDENSDTNNFTNVHLEGISSGLGQGTKPSWLPNNKGVALMLNGHSNCVSLCVAEGCELDAYDTGYDNKYLYDSFDADKIDFSQSQYIGFCTINPMTSNQYFVKLGAITMQTSNVFHQGAQWTAIIENDMMLRSNSYDEGYNLSRSGLENVISNASNIIDRFIGGQYSDDNVYYHKRVNKINHVWIKCAFKVKSGHENDNIEFVLPTSVDEHLSRNANRPPYNVLVFVDHVAMTAWLSGNKLIVFKPQNGWNTTQDYTAYNRIDAYITYIE